MQVKIYEDYDGTIYTVDVPLTSKVDIRQISEELRIPEYVEVGDLAVDRTLLTVWAARNAPKIGFSEELKRKLNSPLSPLIFGGMAVKLHCQSANKPDGPLYRQVKDVDFVTLKREGSLLVKIMLEMGKIFGSRYLYFITHSERWFNLLRGGKRYRVRCIHGVSEDGVPQTGVIDIFCEELPFRHTIKVGKNLFTKAQENLFTVGLENILLSKCQFIFSVPRSEEVYLREAGQEYRILSYHNLKDQIIVGMELKDMKDVAAVLLDHEIGEGPERINIELMKKILGRDKKFILTFQLNLQNLIDRIDILKLSRSEASKVVESAEEILNKMPKIDKKWDKPWWNIDVETPKIRR